MKRNSEKRNRKEQERLKRAFERKQREEQFADKHPFFSNFWKKNMKPLLVIAALAALIFIVLIGGSMLKQYKDSMYWADHHDEDVAMASQPPSLIYDKDPTSRSAKLNFISIYNAIYDEKTMDFTDKVEQSAIDQMNTELEAMADDDYKKDYVSTYDQVMKKWNVERDYRGLYTDASLKTLKPSTTPHKVVQLNNETFETIDTYSKDSNHQDQFAIRVYEWQHQLLDDALKIEASAVTLSNWLAKDGDHWEVQPDLYPAQFATYVTSVEDLELHYAWGSMDKLYTIIGAVTPITEEYAQRHKHYEKVQTDKANRDQALDQVDKRLVVAQQELDTVLANIENDRQAYQDQMDSMKAQISALDVRLSNAEEQADASIERHQAAQESEAAARESREQAEEERELQESEDREQAEEDREQAERESRERAEQESNESVDESSESVESESESSSSRENESEESRESEESSVSSSSSESE